MKLKKEVMEIRGEKKNCCSLGTCIINNCYHSFNWTGQGTIKCRQCRRLLMRGTVLWLPFVFFCFRLSHSSHSYVRRVQFSTQLLPHSRHTSILPLLPSFLWTILNLVPYKKKRNGKNKQSERKLHFSNYNPFPC